MQYTAAGILDELSRLGDEKRFAYNKKAGVTGDQFGVPMGNLRDLVKKIKRNHSLAIDLWKSGNYEAMILASMLLDPVLLTENDMEELMKGAYIPNLVDELCFYAIAKSKLAFPMMKKWIGSDDEAYGRGGWDLACSLISQDALGQSEIESLLTEIEAKMASSLPNKQWAMNRGLCEIGIKYEAYTERCIKIGENLGVYKGQKVPKGCTSAYAPEWIGVGVSKRRK